MENTSFVCQLMKVSLGVTCLQHIDRAVQDGEHFPFTRYFDRLKNVLLFDSTSYDNLFQVIVFSEGYYRFCITKCVFAGTTDVQYAQVFIHDFLNFYSEGLYVTGKGISPLGLA